MTIIGIMFIAIGAVLVVLTATAYRPRAVPTIGSLIIYIWHTAVCLGYYYYLRNDAVDAVTYFHQSFFIQKFGVATDFIPFVVSHIRAVFKTATVVDVFLVFNIVGALGLQLFYFTCLDLTARTGKNKLLIWMFVLLPGMSFWSCAIGKEPIMFFGIQASFFALLNLNRRYLFLVLGLFCAAMVRPHIAAVLAGAIGMSFLFTSKRYRLVGSISVVVIGVGLWFAVPALFQFLQIGAVNSASISDFIELRQETLSGGGSQINISAYNPIEKVFSYLYRPAIFEARSLSMLFAAVENTLFVGITLWFLFQLRRLPLKHWLQIPHSAIMLFFAVGVVTSAWLTGNLGMAARQKYQFMPAFFLMILGARFHIVLLQARRRERMQMQAPRPEMVPAHAMRRPQGVSGPSVTGSPVSGSPLSGPMGG